MVNKKDLAKILAAKKRTTNAEEIENINIMFDTIEELLKDEVDVNIVGFGCFSTVKRDARNAVNPNTGKIFELAERSAFKFVQGKHLKDIYKNKRK